MLTLDEGGVGAREMLTMADKGGRRGLDPLIFAGIICEQPLIRQSDVPRKLPLANFPDNP